MTTVKLALCQMNVVDNKQSNLKKAGEMIRAGADANADFIILPEMFSCPYSNDKFIEYAEYEQDSLSLNTISKLAGQNNVYILAGSIPEKENDKLYNTSYLFDKTGKIIAKHRKMHLFDIDVKDQITFKESDVLTAGDNVTIADTDFGRVGIGICYDVRFPELARLMVEKGVNLKAIQKWVGHADINTTLKYYTKIKEKQAQNDTMIQLSDLLHSDLNEEKSDNDSKNNKKNSDD